MSLLCSPHNMCATLFSNVFSVCKVNGPPPDASQLSPALKNIIRFFGNIFCFAIHHWIQGMHSEHRPKTFYKNPNVRMVIWEWDWERVGLLVGCEKRELLCRKGRVSDRWGKWSVCVTAVNHQNVCTTWVHQCLHHRTNVCTAWVPHTPSKWCRAQISTIYTAPPTYSSKAVGTN